VASAPLSIAAIKSASDDAAELPDPDTFRLQDEIVAIALQSQNAQEGPPAFAEKRPRWQGR
jgi:enoyl-CoA hydratase/carnithine racemase